MTDHAWFARQGGALSWEEQKVEPPIGRQVLIDIEAAGINRPDLLQRHGFYPPPPGASEALGLEVAGTVRETGPEAKRFTPGDRVMALVPGGGYATACLADEGAVMPLPGTCSFAEGAAFPETAFTVFANVFDGGRMLKGERLFVHGATSGIGTMAASIAGALGHEVYGTAGSDEKVRKGEEAGFTKVWNYRTEDWQAEMSALGGCDLVLDMVGGDYVPRNLAMLREGGRHVSIAFLQGDTAKLSIVEVMRRRLVLTGSTLRARSAEEKARLRAAIEAEIMPLVMAGKIRPLVGLELPMAEVAEGHRAMQEGRLVGKAVLLVH